MVTKRTKDEKLKLISDYQACGLSKVVWCNANSILLSGLAVSINGKSLILIKLKNPIAIIDEYTLCLEL